MLVSKATRNKRRELLAGTVNAAGLAFFGLGGLQPLLQAPLTRADTIAFFGYSIVLIALHLLAWRVLRALED